MATILDTRPFAPAPRIDAALRYAAILLVAASWMSAALFGTYILAFYGGNAVSGNADRWNSTLAGLHEARTPFATVAIGAHFVTGGTLLLLGPIQLIGEIRARVPTLHRWLGRLYVLSATLAGLGGLGFIASKGTIGGPAMDIGFGIYGALMVLTATLAFTNARARNFEVHRRWAVRLFALAIGSWLYRMEYGFWFLIADQAGHTADFRGWFDMFMDFAFYIPNLIVAEIFLRARTSPSGSPLRAGAIAVLLGASAFILLATWYFAQQMWLPGIADGAASLGWS